MGPTTFLSPSPSSSQPNSKKCYFPSYFLLPVFHHLYQPKYKNDHSVGILICASACLYATLAAVGSPGANGFHFFFLFYETNHPFVEGHLSFSWNLNLSMHVYEVTS